MSRKISLDCLVFAARSHGTESRRKSAWRWLGIGVLSIALLALFAPASRAQTVTVTVDGTPVPDNTLTLEASVDMGEIMDVEWTYVSGVEPSFCSNPPDCTDTTNPTMVTLGGDSAYKAELIDLLNEPPIGPDQLPDNVPLPEEPYPAALQNRVQIVPANPFALEETGLVTLHVHVTIVGGGEADADVDIQTELPYKVKGEVQNVAIGIPVILQGKMQDSPDYDWVLKGPWDSAATLMDATSRYPEFTPDVRGMYTATVTDMTDPDNPKMVQLDIYAGTWVGVITGQGEVDGRPLAGNCTPCHREAGRAPDIFPEWRDTGHAEIFTDLLNTNSHYGEGCWACHTVGYDVEVFNYGFDDYGDLQYGGSVGEENEADFEHFLAFFSGLTVPGDNWTMMLADYPRVAKSANIQCENCHGPQSSLAHNQSGDPEPPVTGLYPRVDLSANLCGVCHGEPARHGRFQQWQLSLHANYELAEERSTSGNCSRCHTANGFLTWLPVLDGTVAGDPTASLDLGSCDDTTNRCVGGDKAGQFCEDNADCLLWTEDRSHPQTCQTCHDPHQIGTTSGEGPDQDATVRISGDTPLLVAGFKATGVGRGAICMTCHNTRRGLFNDNTPLAESDRSRAPHVGVQADLVMGQNAFFVDLGANGAEGFPPGLPGSHANQVDFPLTPDILQDTCATCHMVETPPPDALSYDQGGTNHTFFAAEDICSQCHNADGGYVGPWCVNDGNPDCTIDDVETPTLEKLATLENLIVEGIKALMDEQIKEGNTIDLDDQATITDVDEIEEMELDESHGRLAITVTLTGQAPLEPVSMADVDVVDSEGTVLGSLYDDSPAYDDLPAYDSLTAPDTLGRAGWNYLLVHGDASHGVHNFNFESAALDNAIAALEVILAPPAAPPSGFGEVVEIRNTHSSGNIDGKSKR